MLTNSLANNSSVLCATGLKFASFFASEYAKQSSHSSRSSMPEYGYLDESSTELKMDREFGV